MARPKKGQPGDEKATKKWRKSMLKAYGGKKGLSEQMAKIGRKGGQNGHTGGFAANPELARVAGAIGGFKSRRGPSKKKEQS